MKASYLNVVIGKHKMRIQRSLDRYTILDDSKSEHNVEMGDQVTRDANAFMRSNVVDINVMNHNLENLKKEGIDA